MVLQEDSKLIDEVVVVGYTPMRKSDFTGSLASVKASELSLSAATAGQALVGKVAGVQVMQTSGAPGEGSQDQSAWNQFAFCQYHSIIRN